MCTIFKEVIFKRYVRATAQSSLQKCNEKDWRFISNGIFAHSLLCPACGIRAIHQIFFSYCAQVPRKDQILSNTCETST